MCFYIPRTKRKVEKIDRKDKPLLLKSPKEDTIQSSHIPVSIPAVNSMQEKIQDTALELTKSSGRIFPGDDSENTSDAGGVLFPCRGACTTRCCQRDPATVRALQSTQSA